MAIQFNCPYCTSPIRVPDSAGGKRGSCPRCKSKILVPKVTAAATAAETADSSQPAPPKSRKKSRTERFTEEPDFSRLGSPSSEGDTPVAAPEPAQAASSFVADDRVTESAGSAEPPPLPTPLPPQTAPISYAKTLRRRRRRRWTTWLPVLFGLILVGGVVAFFLITGNVNLGGTLEATPLNDAVLPPQTINEAMIPADATQKAAVLKYLRETPLPVLRSDRGLMEHEVVATTGGFIVRVYETTQMQFIRIDIRKNKPLRNFLKDHAKQFDKPRVDALEAGLKQFIEEAAESIAKGGGIPTGLLESLRRNVLINSLIRGAGFHLVASIRGQSYLCMYEDEDGRLYYLLPKGTKEFTLKGRPLSDGSKLFPGSYTVEVGAPVLENVSGKTEKKSEPSKSEPPAKTAAPTQSQSGITTE